MPDIRQLFHSYYSVIDRYLWREFAQNLLGITFVLWLIYVATRFTRYIGLAALGIMPGDVIFTLMGYSSIGAMTLLLPIACFLAVMLALGRMNSDSELVVMASCGMGIGKILRNVLIFSGVIATIVGVLSLNVVPSMLAEQYQLETQARIKANTSGLIAGNFKESRKGDWVFYAQKLSDDDDSKMENIFIKVKRDDHPSFIFRAKLGYFEVDSESNDRYLILEQGYRYEGDAGEKDFVILKFETHSILIEKGGEAKKSQHLRATPTSKLWKQGGNRNIAEVQWRISAVIMTIILSCIAIRLAMTGPRKGRYSGLLFAVLIYITYSNLLGITRAWVESGVIPAWLGAIWVHLLMLIILVVMINWVKIRRYAQARSRVIKGEQ